MSSLRRYVCSSCEGVTWGAPGAEECGVCGAISGIGGDHGAIPCEWCVIEPALAGEIYCKACIKEQGYGYIKSCTACHEAPRISESTLCAECHHQMMTAWGVESGVAAITVTEVILPSFAEESRLYQVGTP